MGSLRCEDHVLTSLFRVRSVIQRVLKARINLWHTRVQNYDTPSMPGSVSISMPETWRDTGHKGLMPGVGGVSYTSSMPTMLGGSYTFFGFSSLDAAMQRASAVAVNLDGLDTGGRDRHRAACLNGGQRSIDALRTTRDATVAEDSVEEWSEGSNDADFF